jgi:hypothetical protein
MTAEIHQRLVGLLAEQPLGVLCTRGTRLHASLIAIAASDDLRQILFATPRTTEKFANLAADPDAAFLVHNARGTPDDFQRAMAVTIVGRAREIDPGGAAAFDEVYLARHPALAEFVAVPTTARMTLAVEVYRVVNHFQNVMIYRVSQ